MSNLTGTDKSVILLMTIGEDRAAEVFKHLSQREVQTLSAAMANVTQISNKQLTDVLAEFEQEAEQFAALNINANDYLRSVLVKALGEERAASLLEDILESMGDEEIDIDEVEAVLKRIQRFDPVGVAAKDLRDCLLIQLSQFDKTTPWLEEARLIISDHLDLLANHDFRTLMRVTRLKEDVLKEAVNLIQSLDSRPGQSIQTGEPEYVIPDVLVRKHNGHWTVELNSDSIPRLQINQHYASMCNNARNDGDSQFIRSNLQDAKWLIKSLESRNDTLLRVSRCIVEQQQAFFELGEEYMKPMVLADIAQAVEMHESTISRVTTQKYLHSPRGIFELKYFFSSHVNTEGGGDASSTAIRALVKKLIAAENPAKPLSDSKLTSLLSEQGIMVARRTVAKYRESLSIPPSNQRKQLV